MDIISSLTPENWINIIVGIIPLIPFLIDNHLFGSINKKLVYKSPRDQKMVKTFQRVSYFFLIIAIVVYEYNAYLMLDKKQSFFTKIEIAIYGLIFIIGYILARKFEKPSQIIYVNFKTNLVISIVVTIIITILFSLVMSLYIRIIYFIMRKPFLWNDSIFFVLASVFLLLSLIFSSDSKTFEENSYVVEKIHIWTKSTNSHYVISSNIAETKESISFYYEENSENKTIVIPMHEIAKIEYIIDPEHTLGAERRKILEERRAKKEMKKEMKKHK